MTYQANQSEDVSLKTAGGSPLPTPAPQHPTKEQAQQALDWIYHNPKADGVTEWTTLHRFIEQSALPPQGKAAEYGWLIENGKRQGDGLAYRYVDNDGGGVPAWTEDHSKALRFARRADAEQYAHHDEDAWRIVEHAWDSAVDEVPQAKAEPAGVSENRAAIQMALDALEWVTTSETFFRDPRGDRAGPAIDALAAILSAAPSPASQGLADGGTKVYCCYGAYADAGHDAGCKRNAGVKGMEPPQPTGVGEWCAPGPAASQTRKWLLVFDDADRGTNTYTDEATARRDFHRAEGGGWNCYLFALAPRTPGVVGTEAPDVLQQADAFLALLRGLFLSNASQLTVESDRRRLFEECVRIRTLIAGTSGVMASDELDVAGVPKLELTLLEQKAIATLNTIKAWRDSDGNEPFPDDAREGMELVLMLAAARRKGVR